jgi:hypothetical protein
MTGTGHRTSPVPERPDRQPPAPHAPLAPSPELVALAERLATLHEIGRDLLAAARTARERGEMGLWEGAMREHRIITDEVDAAMQEVLLLVRLRE